MKIIIRHDIIPNVLFELDNGSKVWYTDLPLRSEIRKQADELLLLATPTLEK